MPQMHRELKSDRTDGLTGVCVGRVSGVRTSTGFC
eukprot:COSAG02_NODE_60146_length_272_cov_0.601156_2_plen_34_part_01